MKKNKKIIIVLFLLIIFYMGYVVFATDEEVESNTNKTEEIESIEEEQVKISYEYKEKTNTVLATISSNIELKPTKKSWKLSEDKKQYTFEFNTNTKYETTVTDIYGKTTNILVEITEIEETKIEVKYEYKQSTNTVLATISSNIELQPTKKSWELSEDKKQYTFEFNTNTKYETTVIDIYGNVIKIQLEIDEIKESTVKVNYQYLEETNTVLATIISDIELKPTKKSWDLSENRKQYTFEFNTNTTYTTTVTDINGKIITVPIKIERYSGRFCKS